MKAINKVNLLVVTTILIMTVNTYGQWATEAAVNNSVSTATGAQRYVQSTSDGSGGVIMVWEDYRSGTADIYAQRLNAQGVPQWTTNGVAICTATAGQESPVLVSDGSGGAIIAWQDLRSGNYDIYAQRINATGSVQWTANGVVVSATTLNQQRPQIQRAPSGGANIAWEDNRSGAAGTDYDIYAQRVNTAGVVQWTANGVALCAAVGVQSLPSLMMVGAGSEIIVAWQDQRTADQDIYAQKVNTNGVVLWTANGVAICSATGGQFNPSIISEGNSGIGGGIITWEDYRNGNADIFAQRVNGTGVAQWTANGVAVSIAAGNQTKPNQASDDGGGTIIAWEDLRNGNADIFAQRVDFNGAIQWTANGVTICTSTGPQTNPHIVAGLALNFSDGATITWEDQRGATYDIYAQTSKWYGHPTMDKQWSGNR